MLPESLLALSIIPRVDWSTTEADIANMVGTAIGDRMVANVVRLTL